LNRWNEAQRDADGRAALLRRAEDALQRALALDPTIALSHLADGFIRRAKGDHKGALKAFDQALKLDPNLALAYVQKANQLTLIGRPAQAPPLVDKAKRLSPRDPSMAVFDWVDGRAHFMMGQYDKAIPLLRKSVEARPTLWFTWSYFVSAIALNGNKKDAAAALKDFGNALPGYDLARIKDIYLNEIPNDDPTFQKSLQELYKGLEQAGMK
jgi:tetratricopeptide (TPR) repeat protein